MAKKKEVYKVKPLNENKKNIIRALIGEYDNSISTTTGSTTKAVRLGPVRLPLVRLM